jgi:thiamine transporter
MFAVFSLPFGGSITLFRMFFICLIGYFYGTRAGILTGIACGFLDLILKPYVVHPVQLLIDYPLAFGCLGLSGVFAKSKLGLIKGYILGVAGRYICHVLSGVIFFAMYAGGKNPMIYSLGYNATYIVPEAVVTLILLMLPPVIAAINMVKRQVTE